MFDQGDIERHGIEKLWLMIINEFLLDSAVEPFGVGVHLGGLRVRVPVDFVESFHFLGKVLGKFRAVVGQNIFQREGEQKRHEFKELFGGQAGVTGGCPSK